MNKRKIVIPSRIGWASWNMNTVLIG